MTTPLALAQARLAQAAAALEVAEADLLAVMAGIAPIPRIGIVNGIMPRRFEALLEGVRPHRDLAAAYGAFRRAQNDEAKARSAAHRAKWAPAPAQPPKPTRRPRKQRKVAFVDYAREILAEARAA